MFKKRSHFKLLSILGISLLTSIGVLSGISVANKGVEKVEAATTNAPCIKLYIIDQTKSGWTGNEWKVHIWDMKFDSSANYSSDASAAINDFEVYYNDHTNTFANLNKTDKAVDYKTSDYTYNSGENANCCLVTLPWFIKSCTYQFYLGSDWTSNQSSVDRGTSSTGKYQNVYVFWENGKRKMSPVDQSITATVSTTTYSITTSAGTGGTVSPAYSSSTQKEYTKINLSATANIGYSFSSWSDSGTQSHSIYVKETKTYTASFSANSYDVTFSGTNGSWSPSTIKAPYGTPISRSNNVVSIGSSTSTYTPTPKTGYTPSTTYTVPSTVGTATTVSASTTYNPINYDITYVTNDGTLDGTQKTSYNIETNTFSLPTGANWSSMPTGKQFGGWFTDEELTVGPVTQVTKGSTGDKTFYAKWLSDSVTLTFTSNDSSYGTVSTSELLVEKGTAVSVSGSTITIGTDTVTAIPTTSDAQYTYAFDQWSNNIPSTVTAPLTITAYFTQTVNNYTLTWVYGSEDVQHSGGTSAGSHPYGTTVTAPTVSWLGHDFKGWSPAVVSPLTGDATYTATWDFSKYDITYLDQGGATYSGSNKASLPAKHTYGTTTTLVDGVKTGYIFRGWFKNSACTGTAVTEIGATEITEGITLYAKWESNYYAHVNKSGVESDIDFVYDSASTHYKINELLLGYNESFVVYDRTTGTAVPLGIDGNSEGLWQCPNNEVICNEATSTSFNFELYKGKDDQDPPQDKWFVIAKYNGTVDTTFTVFIGTDVFNMTQTSETPEGFNAQYKLDDAVLSYKGQTIVFKSNKKQYNFNVTRGQWSNELVNGGATQTSAEVHTVFLTGTYDIFLKVKTDSSGNVTYCESYITGLRCDDVNAYPYSLIVDHPGNKTTGELYTARRIDLLYNESAGEFTGSGTIQKDEFVYLYDQKTGELKSFNHIRPDASATNYFDTYDDTYTTSNATCNLQGNFNFYYKTNSWEEKPKGNWYEIYNVIYIARNLDPLEVARGFAEAFNSDIGGECELILSGKEISELISKWRAQATLFNNLDPASAKDYFKGTPTDTTILDCVMKYDYVFTKYYQSGSFKATDDFMGRFTENGEVKLPQHANRSWTIAQSDDQTILIIVIASSGLLLLSSAALLLLLKKKKAK